MNEKVVKNLVSNVKCECCGQHCEPANVDVVGQQEDMWLLSFYCTSCKSQGVVVAAIEEKRGAPGAVTALTTTEKSNFTTEDELKRIDELDESAKRDAYYNANVEEKEPLKLLLLKWMYEQGILH